MKNVQVIDRGSNCTFSIFQMTDEEFAKDFLGEGQDIEFSEDLLARMGDEVATQTLAPVWQRPVRKVDIVGLHGTLFYEFENKKKWFPASKRERDWDPASLNPAQRKLYAG